MSGKPRGLGDPDSGEKHGDRLPRAEKYVKTGYRQHLLSLIPCAVIELVELTVPKSSSGLRGLTVSNVIYNCLEKGNHSTPRCHLLWVPVGAWRPPCPLGFPWEETGSTNLEGERGTSLAVERVNGPPLHVPQSQRNTGVTASGLLTGVKKKFSFWINYSIRWLWYLLLY